MHIRQVTALYFSPTGGVEGIARFAAEELSRHLGAELRLLDFTAPNRRARDYSFSPDELLLAAVPVYAGRVPNKLLPDLKARLLGSGGPAVALCAFGNRSPDEAPRELALLLEPPRLLLQGGRGPSGRRRLGAAPALSEAGGGQTGRPRPPPLAGHGPGGDRPLLHTPPRRRSPRQISQGQAADPLGPVRPLRPVRPGLSHGQHRRGNCPAHIGLYQVPGLCAPLPRPRQAF